LLQFKINNIKISFFPKISAHYAKLFFSMVSGNGRNLLAPVLMAVHSEP